MKKILFTTLLLIFAICPANASGLFYTNATYPITATGTDTANLNNLKKGTSTSKNILFLVETGDAGINTAAKNANIKKIHHIDVHEKTIFIFLRKITVNVYGE